VGAFESDSERVARKFNRVAASRRLHRSGSKPFQGQISGGTSGTRSLSLPMVDPVSIPATPDSDAIQSRFVPGGAFGQCKSYPRLGRHSLLRQRSHRRLLVGNTLPTSSSKSAGRSVSRRVCHSGRAAMWQ
jgi:hypothetical protein